MQLNQSSVQQKALGVPSRRGSTGGRLRQLPVRAERTVRVKLGRDGFSALSQPPRPASRDGRDGLALQQHHVEADPLVQPQQLPQLPSPVSKVLGKSSKAWAAVPSRYKIVLAGSLSFVICNMVSCPLLLVWCVGQ